MDVMSEYLVVLNAMRKFQIYDILPKYSDEQLRQIQDHARLIQISACKGYEAHLAANRPLWSKLLNVILPHNPPERQRFADTSWGRDWSGAGAIIDAIDRRLKSMQKIPSFNPHSE